jgi:hypothetical protein
MHRTVFFGFRIGASLALAVALSSAGPAAAEPRRFDSPEAAVEALISAVEARDPAALVAVFGAENEDVALTGDADEDRAIWRAFAEGYRSFHRIAPDGADRAILYLGRGVWPFPAPIVLENGSWRFDAEAAREEVLARRIGRNELDVIDVMRRYVLAQAIYRRQDPDGDGLLTFAAGVLSSPGSRDGLYWPSEPGAPESPIGDFMARAAADGYSADGVDEAPEPYLGYYFRVLTRQGASAPGGEIDYVVGGRMLAGHALLAFPAAYGDTGAMSFMVGEAGVVYEADLGEDTLEVAGGMTSFDPGDGWTPVSD